MSVIQTYRQTIPLYFGSDPTLGGITTSQLGNSYTFFISPTINIPSNYRASCRLHSANIWFTVPNVSGSQYNNNTLTIYNNSVNQTITFPTGLYDIDAINQYINFELTDIGYPDDVISFVGVPATGHTQVTINSTSLSIIWNLSTISPLLGWTTSSATTGPPATAGEVYMSPNSATFNSLVNILVSCDLCSSSYLGTRGNTNILSSIAPNVSPGSLIQFTPFNLVECSVTNKHINSVNVTLLDQNGNNIDLSSEYWNVLIELVLTPISA